MGAEWPCGEALAMEQWPIRSRGFMAGPETRGKILTAELSVA